MHCSHSKSALIIIAVHLQIQILIIFVLSLLLQVKSYKTKTETRHNDADNFVHFSGTSGQPTGDFQIQENLIFACTD